jgi:hypothetical protein
MSMRFSRSNPPLPGDTIMLDPVGRMNLTNRGPFTVSHVTDGKIYFTDRHSSGQYWMLYEGMDESNCELYSRTYQYDPTQTGDTDEDV